MELVDVKLPKRTKAELKKDCAPYSIDDGDKWPYGLQLRFDKDQLDKIPSLTLYKVGDRIIIQAEARVTEVRSTERQNGEDSRSMEMQIEKINCEPFVKKPLDKMNPKEYREARKSS
ncbi:MAG: capsid staple protein [Candidatus Omnitrophota bacterium]